MWEVGGSPATVFDSSWFTRIAWGDFNIIARWTAPGLTLQPWPRSSLPSTSSSSTYSFLRSATRQRAPAHTMSLPSLLRPQASRAWHFFLSLRQFFLSLFSNFFFHVRQYVGLSGSKGGGPFLTANKAVGMCHRPRAQNGVPGRGFSQMHMLCLLRISTT